MWMVSKPIFFGFNSTLYKGCFYLLLSKNNRNNQLAKPIDNPIPGELWNYIRSLLRSNNSIQLSMIICMITSTILGILMNPIISIAQILRENIRRKYKEKVNEEY